MYIIITNYLVGGILLDKLSHVWVQFYTSILPTLQAFFAPIQVSKFII